MQTEALQAEIERLRQTSAIAEANRQIAEEENQRLRTEVAQLRLLNKDKFRHLEAYRKAATEDKAEIERLRSILARVPGKVVIAAKEAAGFGATIAPQSEASQEP